MQRKTIAAGLVVACVLYALYITVFVTLSNRAHASPSSRSAHPTATMRPTLTPAPKRTPLASGSATRQPAQPTATSSPAAVPDQRITVDASARGAASLPAPASINGLPIDRIVILTDAARQNLHAIFTRGLAVGRNPRAFLKVGDSTMVWPPLLAVFENSQSYSLGPYVSLQPAITYLSGSFARDSIAAQKGMHTWSEFDSAWAAPALCVPGEGPLACELRRQNPSIAIIRLGTNDAYEPAAFEAQMRKIVNLCMSSGVIPILGTKPDRVEGPDNTINKIVYKLADEYKIPLWDYDLVASTVPGKGLQVDGMHYLGDGPHDYASPATFQHADSLEDLTAMIMLDAILREVQPDKVK